MQCTSRTLKPASLSENASCPNATVFSRARWHTRSSTNCQKIEPREGTKNKAGRCLFVAPFRRALAKSKTYVICQQFVDSRNVARPDEVGKLWESGNIIGMRKEVG
jgi:hypothetical protein